MAIPNGHTETSKKCVKLLKPPLAKLKIQWRVLVVRSIDDFIIMRMTLEPCIDSI